MMSPISATTAAFLVGDPLRRGRELASVLAGPVVRGALVAGLRLPPLHVTEGTADARAGQAGAALAKPLRHPGRRPARRLQTARPDGLVVDAHQSPPCRGHQAAASRS